MTNHQQQMGDEMKFENVLTALAMVIIGGLAVWFVFGGIITNAITTIVNVL